MVAVFRQDGGMRTRIPLTAAEVFTALARANWDVKAAARALDVSERTLYRRMREYDIRSQLRYSPPGEAA